MGRNPIGYARRVDRWAGKSSRMVNRVGGEIFAKTAKTPPLQSALRGGHCDPHRNPNAAHCRLHTHIMPPTPPTYGDPTVFTTTRHGKGGHSQGGRALAALGIAPTKNLIDNRLPLSPLCAYYAHRMPPTYGDPTFFLQRRDSPRRYGLREIELRD